MRQFNRANTIINRENKTLITTINSLTDLSLSNCIDFAELAIRYGYDITIVSDIYKLEILGPASIAVLSAEDIDGEFYHLFSRILNDYDYEVSGCKIYWELKHML